MKKLPLLWLFCAMLSCSESDIKQHTSGQSGRGDIATDASGRQYPGLDPSVIYCGPGWGRKFCRFLSKYDGTVWADTDNYFSDFSDIKFSNFPNQYFTFFYNQSYCDGWTLGETTYDGMKWNIRITKDQWDVFWFEYDYYGSGENIEYTISYKYEVIDGVLTLSSSEGLTFVFDPSESNYADCQ